MSQLSGIEVFLPRFDAEGRLPGQRGWQRLEDDVLLRLELAPMFWEGVRLLDSRRRNAVLLRDGLELPIEGVAQLLELPLPETVLLLHEARLMLRGLVDHLLDESGEFQLPPA
jgi:DNA-directed RNA polymerase specialized sigma24 family protein